MDDHTSSAPASNGVDVAIDSRAGFEQALQHALAECAQADVGTLWWCDRDFTAWPLARPETLAALACWAGPRRRLRLLAVDYAPLAQRFPRWTSWRRQWSHIVDCRVVPDDLAAKLPTLLYAPQRLSVRLFDPLRWRGRVSRDAAELSRCTELVDALSQRAEDSFPVTTLGL